MSPAHLLKHLLGEFFLGLLFEGSCLMNEFDVFTRITLGAYQLLECSWECFKITFWFLLFINGQILFFLIFQQEINSNIWHCTVIVQFSVSSSLSVHFCIKIEQYCVYKEADVRNLRSSLWILYLFVYVCIHMYFILFYFFNYLSKLI